MKKNLVAMLLAVGVIATAAGCGSTESTSTTSTTEYVTEEATTEETQVEEATEYVEAATEEVAEETAEEITVDELTAKVREAMEAAPYVVSDYTVLVNSGANHNYTSYYNKETGVIYKDSEANGVYWTDIDTDTLYMLDAANNSYNIVNSKEYTDYTVMRAQNIDEIYKTAEADSAVYTLDNITDGIATVTINYVTNGNSATAVMTINTETGLIESKHYTETNESGEVVSEVKLNLSYPTEGTPEYDEFIQKTTIPAEAIEAANNQ